MGKKEQVPARAIFVQGSLWVWSATSRGRPPDGGLSGVVRARRARAAFYLRAVPSARGAAPALSNRDAVEHPSTPAAHRATAGGGCARG